MKVSLKVGETCLKFSKLTKTPLYKSKLNPSVKRERTPDIYP